MTGFVSAVVMGIVLAAPPDPQSPVTLDQAIAEALKAEPGLQAARVEVEVSRGEQSQAALRRNPDVSFEQRGQTGGPDRQTSISVDMPLDLFRRGPRIESADRAIDRTAALVRDRERLLVAAVRDRYGDALTAARRLEVMDAVVVAGTRTYELLSNRVSEGAAPPLERDLALVELRRLEGARALEAGRVAVAVSGLKVLLGRPLASPLILADTLDRLAGAPARESVAPASERSDVQAAAADLEMARAQTRLAQQGGKPELSVFGGYMRMNAGFPQMAFAPGGTLEPIHAIFHNVAVGVKVSLPVFDRGQGAMATATAREAAAAQTLNGRRLAAAGEVDAAEARLAAARQALTAYSEDTRSLARKNVEVVRETYVLGRATLLEVLTEQRRYLDFEAAYIAALAEAFAAATDLQRAKGALQ